MFINPFHAEGELIYEKKLTNLHITFINIYIVNMSKSMKRFVPQEFFCLKSIQEGKYNFLNILKITASNSNLFCLSHSAQWVCYLNSS